MQMQTLIESKLKDELSPEFLEVINESHMHSGPATESHFKVIAVTDAFEGKMLIARHRLINSILADELEQIHALALHTMTSAEYEEKSGKVAASPQCEGGSKKS